MIWFGALVEMSQYLAAMTSKDVKEAAGTMKKLISIIILCIMPTGAYAEMVELGTTIEVPRPPNAVAAGPTYNTSQFEINGATQDVAFMFTAPISGEIEGVSFRTATVTTGATLDVRLETVDLTSGDHSGSLKDTNSNASQVVADGDDNVWFNVTFTSPATVTKGDLLAIVLDVSSGTPVSLQIAQFQDDVNLLPYDVEDDGTPATLYTPVMAVDYQTYGYVNVHGTIAANSLNTTTYNNTSTPDCFALRFSLPYRAKISGAWVWADLDGDASIKFYNYDGVTALTSFDIDKDIPLVGAAAGIYYFYFPVSVTVEANRQYFISIEPSSGTNMIAYDYGVESGKENAMIAGPNFVLATAKDPTGVSSWTVTSTKQPFIGLLIDAIEISGGGAYAS